MDELELLKKDWKKQDTSSFQYSQKELYAMLKKKSSSLVKWIFIISILEFLFWIGLEVFTALQGYNDVLLELDLNVFYNVVMVINYAVILVFVGFFFYNYKKIKITDNAKQLMHNILTTRKTVKMYVWFNIIFFAITFMIMAFLMVKNMDEIPNEEVWIVMGVMFGIMLIFVGIIWLFYRLLYGILTRKLHKNYKELEDLDL